MTTSNQCPECGYPDTKDGQHFKGIYTSEVPCPRCQFFQGCVPVEVLTKADVQNEGSVVTATRAPYPTAWANYDMKDIELHVRVRMHNDCVMGYEVRVLKLHDDGIGDPHKFEMSGESGALECTPDIEKADRLIEGTIKWDGCSHNNFAPDESNRGYIHGCSRQDLMRLGELYRRLFDIAMERMPGNGEYLTLLAQGEQHESTSNNVGGDSLMSKKFVPLRILLDTFPGMSPRILHINVEVGAVVTTEPGWAKEEEHRQAVRKLENALTKLVNEEKGDE